MIERVAVRIGAAGAFLFLYKLCPASVLAPEAEYWDSVRYEWVEVVSRLFGRVLHTDRQIRETEFAGTLPMEPDEAERLLWENGFERNPVAAVKTRDGDPEIGSWARRETPTATRQLHVMLFQSKSRDGGVDVYAHEEFSSLNPRVAVEHYRGIDQQEKLGVELARDTLPLEYDRESAHGGSD